MGGNHVVDHLSSTRLMRQTRKPKHVLRMPPHTVLLVVRAAATPIWYVAVPGSRRRQGQSPLLSRRLMGRAWRRVALLTYSPGVSGAGHTTVAHLDRPAGVTNEPGEGTCATVNLIRSQSVSAVARA
eukprot:5926554-Prymnesium_polylepis.2